MTVPVYLGRAALCGLSKRVERDAGEEGGEIRKEGGAVRRSVAELRISELSLLR